MDRQQNSVMDGWSRAGSSDGAIIGMITCDGVGDSENLTLTATATATAGDATASQRQRQQQLRQQRRRHGDSYELQQRRRATATATATATRRRAGNGLNFGFSAAGQRAENAGAAALRVQPLLPNSKQIRAIHRHNKNSGMIRTPPKRRRNFLNAYARQFVESSCDQEPDR